MKEKVKRLAKENFEYELPEILLSKEQISIRVEMGSIATGSFCIANAQEREMKGVVYSSLSKVHITNSMFVGKMNEIQYSFNAKKELPGQIYKGKLFIVSNCGEISVPFSIEVTQAYAQTSLGKIKDVFHFTNLAQSNWEEALQLFETMDFKRIFLKEESLKSLYTSLIKGNDSNIALEEFLIAIQKKVRTRITADKTICKHTDCISNFMDKVTLTKDGWGYEYVQVHTDAPFLLLEKNEFTTKDFIGNSFELEYVVDFASLRQGHNFGKIVLDTMFYSMEVMVEVSVAHERPRNDKERKKKELTLSFLQNYLNLRVSQVAQDQYIADLAEIIKEGKGVFSYWEHRLFELHYYIMDRQPQTENMIREMEKKQEVMKKESLLSHATFLYLRALYLKKEEYIKEAASTIRAYYENDMETWKMLWFLLYLDEEYDRNPDKKWADIEAQLEKGANSPILYHEACICLKSDKKAKKIFSKQLLFILSWGIRMNCLDQELIDLYCFTAEQEGRADFFIMRPLYSLYNNTRSKDILFCICHLLIQNNRKESDYFIWFRRGEEANLKLENLYEYYMYTLKENYQTKLPAAVLMFFQYENHLSWEKKAYLYAYIVINKNKDMGTYVLYDKLMQKFVIEQIKEERINENLSILYKEFIRLEDIGEGLIYPMTEIMFRHKLVCENKKMTGVYISHIEMEKEEYLPLEKGSCYMNVFTESPSIVFADKKGNRYAKSVSHQTTRLLHIHGLAQKCYETCKNNPMLMMNLFEKIDKYQESNEHSVYVQRRCVLLPGLKEYFKGRCYEELITYYFDNMESEALKEILLIADFEILNPRFRSKAIHYCMIHELHEKALFSLKEYGWEDIPINRLIRFCAEEIEKEGMERKNKFLLELSLYLFTVEKYNETILLYLVRYFEGSMKMLLQLWNCAKNFELDTYVLEERLLSQMLFCESYVRSAYDVFHSYYNNDGDGNIIKAFLCYNSYKYLLNERVIHAEIFELLKKENCCEESTVCILALLSYYGEQESLSPEELKFCQEQIEKMTLCGIILPFYKKFTNKMTLPLEVRSHHFVEYKCNPKSQVKIHYILESSRSQEQYTTEAMKNVYYGIHVAKFMLFQDETLQYYIAEDDGKEEQITESVRVEMKNTFCEEPDDSLFGLLNLILTAKEMQDEKTMLQLMEDYVRINYANEKLIRIL